MFLWKSRFTRFLQVLWRYLNQPLFDNNTKIVLEPWQFCHNNNIQFLESCWELQSSSQEKHS